MPTVSYIHTRNHKRSSMCDKCNSPLLGILDEIIEEDCEELYCPVCDVGEHVEPDNRGETNACARCDTTLATWFPYALCPFCFRSNKSGTHKCSSAH